MGQIDKEGIEKDIEHHKQDQLKKQQEGKGHWKEELASESESSVCWVWFFFPLGKRGVLC